MLLDIPEPKVDQKEVVACWRVPLYGKIHKIDFEHGTTSGKRVLWIDDKVNFLLLVIVIFKMIRKF
jgi:hypothetical protein